MLCIGITIWGNASKTLLTPLFILQKKIVLMATSNDGYPDVPGPLAHTIPLFYQNFKSIKMNQNVAGSPCADAHGVPHFDSF